MCLSPLGGSDKRPPEQDPFGLWHQFALLADLAEVAVPDSAFDQVALVGRGRDHDIGVVVRGKREFDQHEGAVITQVTGKIDGVVGRNQIVGGSEQLNAQNLRTFGTVHRPHQCQPLQPGLDDEGRTLPNSGNRRP